jgi:hypothetical protein
MIQEQKYCVTLARGIKKSTYTTSSNKSQIKINLHVVHTRIRRVKSSHCIQHQFSQVRWSLKNSWHSIRYASSQSSSVAHSWTTASLYHCYPQDCSNYAIFSLESDCLCFNSSCLTYCSSFLSFHWTSLESNCLCLNYWCRTFGHAVWRAAGQKQDWQVKHCSRYCS